MENKQVNIEILNDLIQINNDRIEGYEKALKEIENGESDLKGIFTGMIDESRQLRNALGTEVEALGADMDKGTTASGKIYRVWMDLKAVFTGSDRHAILANCEYGEDAAQKAYATALESDDLSGYLRDLVTSQKQTLRQSHNKIKALRDAVPQ